MRVLFQAGRGNTFLVTHLRSALFGKGKNACVTTSTGIAGRQYAFLTTTLHRYVHVCIYAMHHPIRKSNSNNTIHCFIHTDCPAGMTYFRLYWRHGSYFNIKKHIICGYFLSFTHNAWLWGFTSHGIQNIYTIRQCDVLLIDAISMISQRVLEQVKFLYIISIFVVVNFVALVQASDFGMERRKVLFLSWMQDSNPGSLKTNVHHTEWLLTKWLGYLGWS